MNASTFSAMSPRVMTGGRRAGLSSRSGIIRDASCRPLTENARSSEVFPGAANASAHAIRALTIRCRVPYPEPIIPILRAPPRAVAHLNETVHARKARGRRANTTNSQAPPEVRRGRTSIVERRGEGEFHVECDPGHRCQLRRRGASFHDSRAGRLLG